MPVQSFTPSESLDSKIKAAMGDKPNKTENNNAERSEASAKEATQAFSKEDKSPLAAHGPEPAKPGITFAAQENLPKLPIPELESTCKKYLAALEPLQTQREHEDTEAAIRDFLRADGPELQEKLKKYATGKSSYIEQFWYDSFLNFDNPVVLNLNPFFLLEDDPTPARNDQVTRAASLTISALSFVRAVRKEELPPDMVRKQPLDMYQYTRLFGTARIPTETGCQIAQDSESTHIIITCRGQFYWFDTLDENNDLVMTEKDLAENLGTIVADAEQISVQEAAKGAIGVLSTENRKIWSGLRDVLSREEGSNNADCLAFVDSALFILCLDDTEPLTGADLCMNMLCGSSVVDKGVQIGTCMNRWYDKLQIIVCKNGSAGINFEHTGVDGHTVLRFASDVYTDTILRYAKSINGQAPSLWASTSPDPSKRDPESFGDVNTTPHKLEWDMIPELSTALRFAETRLADLIQQNEFETLEFMQYGSNFMKTMGFSPDAFVQMGFQAAYYGLYGRIECMYEPAMTKMFYHGRTEAVRQVTNESVNFVRTFWGDNPASEKCEALRKACEKHVAMTKDCSQAQGQDRHLYALLCVWQRSVDDEGEELASNGYSSPRDEGSEKGTGSGVGSPARNSTLSQDDSTNDSPSRQNGVMQQMPALFADGGWDRLNTTILSTSNCGNPSLRQFGFGPTSGDGFGIGYIIKDGTISVCASSKHRQTKRYIDALESYFLEVRRLLRQTRPRSTNQSRPRDADQQRPKAERRKSRGRNLLSDQKALKTPIEEPLAEEEDDGLGGYGFFDAGMLLQAKKAKDRELPSDKAAARRDVGRKLRLVES